MTDARAVLTAHADAASVALEDASVEYDETPRWRWFKRKRLLDEIERRLAEFQDLERRRAEAGDAAGAACINPRCRREHPEPATRLIGYGLSGSRYVCDHCKATW